jgi:general secretion pathway protein G
MQSRFGLSLLELLILIALVGILSVVVVPQLTEASGNVRETTLHSELENMRAKLYIYRKQHGGRWPSGENFISQMTLRTNRDGRVMPVGADPDEYPFGPYVLMMPVNPLADPLIADRVEVGAGAPGGGEAGWHYNPRTGYFASDVDG